MTTGCRFALPCLILLLGFVGCRPKAATVPTPSHDSSVAAAPTTTSDLPSKVPQQRGDEPDLLDRGFAQKSNRSAAPTEPVFAPPQPVEPAPSAPIPTQGPTRSDVKIALEDIRIAIDNYSLASGRMPTPAFTLEIVRQAAPKYAQLIINGAIVIHPAQNREEIWAYESKSNQSTLYVLFATGVEEMELSAFRRRLGR